MSNTQAALVEALKALLLRDERNTCQHTETHRGGAIWEICDGCGMKWADDRGGKPEWQDPPEWEAARAALAQAEAAQQQDGPKSATCPHRDAFVGCAKAGPCYWPHCTPKPAA